jgi:VWFA-related protein
MVLKGFTSRLRDAALIPVCVAMLAAQQKPDADLVTVSCVVSTRAGTSAGNLKPEYFRLLDSGQPREIRNLWQPSELPVTIALVADISGNQAETIASHREAIAEFLKQAISPRDRGMVVQVGQKTLLLAGLTGSGADLMASVDKIGLPKGKRAPVLGPPCRNSIAPHSCGSAELWHGLYYTAKELKPLAGRKAIVVLSDGVDTGSDIHLNDLIEMAQSAGTLVYAIRYENPGRLGAIGGTIAGAFNRGMEHLSRETGGLAFSERASSDVFSRIESDLRNTYVLGFIPPAEARDGKFHNLRVTATQPDLAVRSRAGYRALNPN